MNMLAGATTTGLEEQEDRLGGGGWVIETDVYEANIKAVYLSTAASGAIAANVILEYAPGKEYKETIYISTKNGEFHYVDKNDANKKHGLPGFIQINDLCLIVTGKELKDQTQEDKVLKIWDPELRAESPKSVPVLTELTGQKILVAINKNLENKSDKQPDGTYAANAETRDTNTIEKFFHPEKKVTVSEAKRGLDAGEFIYAWTEKNRGNVRDKRTIKDGDAGGHAGRPGGAPNAGAGGQQRKSLFD